MLRTVSGFGPMTRVLGVLGMGMVAGAALTGLPGAQAQDAGSAALAAQVAELAARVDELEAAKDEPQTLKAPFSVVDASGAEILHVDSQGGTGVLALLGSPGSIWLRAGDDLSIEAANATGSATITVDGEGGTFKVGTNEGSVMIGSQGGGPVIQGLQGSEEVISFDAAGGGPQLSVKQAGKSVVLSTNASELGIQVDDGGAGYTMGAFPMLHGFVAYKGGQPLAGLSSNGDDKYRVGIYSSGKPIFIGGHNGSHVGLFVSDVGGNEIANIDSASGSAGGRLKLLGPGGKDLVSLGTPDGGGDGGALSLTQGGNKVTLGYGTGTGASLVFAEGGEEPFSVKKNGDGGVLTLGKGDRTIAMKAADGETVIVAKSGSRRTEMGIGKKSTGFVIGEASNPLAALGDNGDNKPFLGIYGGGGSKALLSAGYQPDGKLAFRLGESGKPLALLGEAEGNAGSANLSLFVGNSLGVSLGPIAGRPKPNLRIYEGGDIAFAAGVTPGGSGALAVYDSGVDGASAGLEASGGGNGNVYVAVAGKVAASINAADDPGKPVVVIRNQGGVAVAHLGLSQNGSGGWRQHNRYGPVRLRNVLGRLCHRRRGARLASTARRNREPSGRPASASACRAPAWGNSIQACFVR